MGEFASHSLVIDNRGEVNGISGLADHAELPDACFKLGQPGFAPVVAQPAAKSLVVIGIGPVGLQDRPGVSIDRAQDCPAVVNKRIDGSATPGK